MSFLFGFFFLSHFVLGVFLIPYFIILIICGIPMLFMELAVGQFTGRGPIGALGQLCPLFKGIKIILYFLFAYYFDNFFLFLF